MSTYNLDRLFNPGTVALVSAGAADPASLAREKRLIRNLLRAGFKGPVMPVCKDRDAVEGVLAYPDVSKLPRVPDLTVACLAVDQAPELLEQLGGMGAGAVIVLDPDSSRVDSPR